jgi:hypothetical protein
VSNEQPIWDQLPGESDAAYARFLVYRNLGPARSLDKAYTAQHDDKASKGVKRRQVSGQWYRDSVEHEWRRRAERWDISNMREHGRSATINFIAAVSRLSEKTAAGLDSVNVKSWSDAVSAINALGSLISADAISAIVEDTEASDDSNRKQA